MVIFMFHEIIKELHISLSEFRPYADIMDDKSWNALDEEWRKKAVRLGESYLKYEYPALPAVLYMDLCRTGNRRNYEKVVFNRRSALNALILAECVERKGRFLDDIINGIFVTCEESAWQLPAHNMYARDTSQLMLPDTSAPVLDLFACETAATLAVAYYLLKTVLNDISPFITKRIKTELEHRIFLPYLHTHFWWMGDGKEHMNNWTIWCTQNILFSVLLTDQEKERKEQVLNKACISVDYFLAEYGEDGCCEEGAQYYRHSALCLFNTIEILNAVTDNAFFPLYRTDKIKNMAAYIFRVHIDDKYYVNFADCSAIAGRSGAREFLFGKRIEDKQLMTFAAKDFKAAMAEDEEFLLLKEENNLYHRLQNAFTVSEIKSYADKVLPKDNNHCEDVPSDIYYPSTGLFIIRDKRRLLAVKAGHNADSHNHNDVGSFTVYKDGKPMFIDIGVETYTQKTFSPGRYEIWTMQSAYHNLPAINDIMQRDGKKFAASNVTWYIEERRGGIEMDIAGAYPEEAEIASYKRRAVMEKEERVVITDEFSALPEKVVLSLMTHEKPRLVTMDPLLMEVGTLGTAAIEGGCIKEIEEIAVIDEKLKPVWGEVIYRILVQATEQKMQIEIY
jgi:hypothetical protein